MRKNTKKRKKEEREYQRQARLFFLEHHEDHERQLSEEYAFQVDQSWGANLQRDKEERIEIKRQQRVMRKAELDEMNRKDEEQLAIALAKKERLRVARLRDSRAWYRKQN